jgi:hypothetical protein
VPSECGPLANDAQRDDRHLPDGWHVHHTCQNRRCINPVHLAAVPPGVHYEMHAEDKGKKLTREDALEIRSLWTAREPVAAIAHRFGVSEGTVHEIVRGTTWRRAGGIAERAPSVCACCGGPIPGDRHSQARTCSGRCRTQLYRARQAAAA